MKTKKEKAVITKQRTKVLELIEKGWSTEKILKKYPDLKKMQVAAYRAHVTMGTY